MVSASADHVCSQQTDSILPNLLVIGAMKCATTALHRYLELHPDVAMSERKELNFFVGLRFLSDRRLISCDVDH